MLARPGYSKISVVVSDLHSLEKQYFATPSPTQLTEARKLLTEYQDEANRETHFLAQHATARRYGESDRPSKTLAYLPLPPRGTTYITELQTLNGDTVHAPADVLDAMTQHYANLYTSSSPPQTTDPEAYFDTIALVWLND